MSPLQSPACCDRPTQHCLQRSLVASCRTLWDQTALLAQLQIDPADLAAR
jgi:hypothetical protein